MIPQRIQAAAQRAIEQYVAGTIRPRKLAGKHGEVIDLPNWYRLYRRPGGEWRVMTHETYSKYAAGSRH